MKNKVIQEINVSSTMKTEVKQLNWNYLQLFKRFHRDILKVEKSFTTKIF